ncbi:hypothetical protein ABIC83_002788 [Roseateles asaccharophilus]|uniref:hypothetical protein n=1 Tax=Roseateles asaccharophilus TaxID=582607 RepID=UPI0038370190
MSTVSTSVVLSAAPDGLYWYMVPGQPPEPVLVNRARYGDRFKGFNGREQPWLREGETLVGPVRGPGQTREAILECFRRFERAFQDARKEEGITDQNNTDSTYASVTGIYEGVMRELADLLSDELPELSAFQVSLADGQSSRIEKAA